MVTAAPVSDLPTVDYPTIQVGGGLLVPTRTMASSVATLLERQFSTIAGLDSTKLVNTSKALGFPSRFSSTLAADITPPRGRAGLDCRCATQVTHRDAYTALVKQ